jgi:hypothetical protein
MARSSTPLPLPHPRDGSFSHTPISNHTLPKEPPLKTRDESFLACPTVISCCHSHWQRGRARGSQGPWGSALCVST